MKISEVHAYQIYDSRGTPTVGCTIILDNGMQASACVPSGASVGTHEALELRDGGTEFMGKGVTRAIEHIQTHIAPVLIGKELDALALDQELIALDPDPQKKLLGANAVLPVSIALFKAHARALETDVYDFIAQSLEKTEVTLPIPLINVINGGAHAQNNLAIQEYLIIPYGARTFAQAMGMAIETFYTLKKLLQKYGKSTCTGDEGGFAPIFSNCQEPLDFLSEAVAHAGYDSTMIGFGLDVAASSLYNEKSNSYTIDNKQLSPEQLIKFYDQLTQTYPIMYLEDPCAQDDWASWSALQAQIGSRVHVIGDDLLVTNAERVHHAIKQNAARGAIIKPNQIGTVSESLDVVLLCQQNNWVTIASHRSGETCDSFIADFALGAGTTYFKCGGCSHGERLSKYNRLIQIEHLRSASSW